jgi:hypothetical protein
MVQGEWISKCIEGFELILAWAFDLLLRFAQYPEKHTTEKVS